MYLSKSRLGDADELTIRSRCALVEQQPQHSKQQKNKAFVPKAIIIFDRVLGNDSQRFVPVRQLLANIQKAENERLRETELQEIDRSID